MKLLRIAMTALALSASAPGLAPAQDTYSDLYIYGYMQAFYVTMQCDLLGPKSTTFLLQQTNVMASKEFVGGFSTFLNLQFTNSYHSMIKWGGLNIEEGWVKYKYDRALNIKAGLIIPSFNAMLQVQNRTPLLPYIFRPFVYESILTEQLDLETLLPVRANVEVYGSVPVSGLNLEYALFIGNSESEFIVSGGGSFQVSGMDTTTYKMYGGRIGVAAPWLRAGVSMSSDKENHVQMGLGALQRNRYGADASLRISRFTLEGEAILVRTTIGDREQGILTLIRSLNPMLGKNFDRDFYYGTLLCDITDAVFGYGSYSYLRINDIVPYANGINEWTIGGGWRPIDQVVLKGQYVWVNSSSPVFKVEMGNALFAVSVMF
jgi:hypothetical protein